MTGDLRRYKIQLYHGLSHELPVGIEKTGIPSVVTMHDLIHERYPEQYSRVDVKIYRKKFTHACKHASTIIAISAQTRDDLVNIYGIDPKKIVVCYQSCNPAFGQVVPEHEKQNVLAKFGLPARFLLYVGSIIQRKNLLSIIEALPGIDEKLVVIGDGGSYKKRVMERIASLNLSNRVIFLSDNPIAKADPAFQTARCFPAIYQSAICMIYPSFFEGFGIPVLESLFSRLPVITSNRSSLPEAGGDAALYVNPASSQEIGTAIRKILNDEILADQMREKGLKHASEFTTEKTAQKIMGIYTSLQ